MGIRGRKSVQAVTRSCEPRENNLHRQLCLLAGKWLRKHGKKPYCPYVAIEVVTANEEVPDVFAWNYWTTVVIEVKVSRSDFLADKQKPFRLSPEAGMGEYRYYCCPSGLIKPEEIPDNWGLLYANGGSIEVVKDASRQEANYFAALIVCSSIMRREGIRGGLFDYR